MVRPLGVVFAVTLLGALCAPSPAFADDEGVEGASACPVPDVSALTTELEQLERQILLTRYADAVEGLRVLQRDMTCVPEPPEARLLGRLFLNLGYALHRLGLISDGEQAFEVAAGIDPSLTWNSTFAASYGVKYYEIAQKVRGGPTVDLKVGSSDMAIAWYIDGNMQRPGATLATVHPGWHFIQVAQEGAWVGDWFNLQGEVSLDLAGLLRRLDPDAEGAGEGGAVPIDASAKAPTVIQVDDSPTHAGLVPVNSRVNLWVSSGTAVAVGAGLIIASIPPAREAAQLYDDIFEQASNGDVDQPTADDVYFNEYEPLYKKAVGLRVSGGALLGVGVAVGLGTALTGREGVALTPRGSDGVRLVAAPGGLGLAGSF